MKKIIIFLIIILPIFLGIVIYLNYNKITLVFKKGNVKPPILTIRETPEMPDVAAQIMQADVFITPNGFMPQTIMIGGNTAITFTNKDIRPHSLAISPEDLGSIPGFNTTEPLAPGESYTVSFRNIGTYNYQDPELSILYKGTIIVGQENEEDIDL